MKRKWLAGCLFLAGLAGQGLAAPGDFETSEMGAPDDTSKEPVAMVNGLEVEILWGGNSLVRVGRETPVTVRAKSGGPAIAGSAILYVPTGKGNCYVMEKELSVAAGEEKQVVFSVPVDYATSSILVEYRDEKGTLYARETLVLRLGYNAQEIYIGAVSEDIKSMEVFDRLLLNEYRGTATRLFDFKADTLPKEKEAYGQYDLFLWDAVNRTDISEKQKKALDNWVYEGGILIIGNDSDLCRPLEKGEIERERWGRGQYVYCGFSLRQVSALYSEEAQLRNFLYEAVGTERLNAIDERIQYGYNDYWDAQNTTLHVDTKRLPSVWQYGLVLALYLMLMGPILYTVLKRRERRQLLRRSMIGLSLLFTAVIYLMGSRTRFTRPFLNYASIQEIRDGTLMETVYVNVSSPYHAPYSFRVNGSYALSPVPYYNYSGAEQALGEESCRLYICYQDEETTVRVEDEVPFTNVMLRLNRNDGDTYGEGITGEVHLFCGELTGYLENRSGQDLERVCLLTGGHMVFIEKIAAGETVDLSQEEPVFVPGYEYSKIMNQIAGREANGSPIVNQEAALAAWRLQLVSFYWNNMMTGERNEALVMAFPVTENMELLSSDDVDVDGVTLVTAVLSADFEKNGQLYLPSLEKSTESLQGNYDVRNNSTYEHLNVIQYDFGSLSVQKLMVTWAKEQEEKSYRRAFHGTMEFYNWKTKSYDHMEQKTEYDRSELNDYLNEHNCLTVRYEDATTEEYQYEILLPCFSAVGRKSQ